MNPDAYLLDAAWDREDIFDDADDAEADDFLPEGWDVIETAEGEYEIDL